MPGPDGSPACGAALAQHFHTAVKGSCIGLAGFDEKLDRRAEIIAQITGLQQEQGRIEQEVKLFMEDNELAASEKYRVSWGNVSTVRLDTERLKEELPEIYLDYAKPSVSRRFQVRAA